MTGMVAGQLPVAASATSVTSSTASLAASFMPAYTGDVTSPAGSTVNTLATVNANVGTFQGLTVNGKGLVTAAVNQSYAPLASPTFTGTPAAPTAANNTSTTQLATTAFVRTGTATNDNAAAGQVGEVISVVGTSVALPSNVATQVATITLTAGDWDVYAEAWVYSLSGTTGLVVSINTVTAANTSGPALNTSSSQLPNAGSGSFVIAPSACRVSVAASTSMYLNVYQFGTASGATATGELWARRAR
jgi:hypothetical protein